MLVLSRKKNQTIVIDSQIEVEVLQVKGNTVRLGIKAPNDVKILRGELQPTETRIIEIPLHEELSNNDEVASGDLPQALPSLPSTICCSMTA